MIGHLHVDDITLVFTSSHADNSCSVRKGQSFPFCNRQISSGSVIPGSKLLFGWSLKRLHRAANGGGWIKPWTFDSQEFRCCVNIYTLKMPPFNTILLYFFLTHKNMFYWVQAWGSSICQSVKNRIVKEDPAHPSKKVKSENNQSQIKIQHNKYCDWGMMVVMCLITRVLYFTFLTCTCTKTEHLNTFNKYLHTLM